jgi:micrococcal nuclease
MMSRSGLFLFLVFFLFFIPFGKVSATQWMYVRWVNDGDTIVLSDGRVIRYIGIDAPEVEHNGPQKKIKKAEVYGYEAKAFNKSMVNLKQVRLEFDSQKYDRYGRTLSYVFLKDKTFVNEEMVRKGYAYCMLNNPNKRHSEMFLKVQQDAMGAKIGMWKNWKEKPEKHIGNLRSKRFHIKACSLGKKIIKKNIVIFNKRWDAFYNGFAPCKICIIK